MKARVAVPASAVALVLLIVQTAHALTGQDVAASAGIYEVIKSWSANPADYDADGDEDLLIVRHHTRPAVLWRNNGNGTYSDSGQVFPVLDRHDCAWGDVNLDGRLDTYCTHGAVEGNGVGANELWIQDSSGLFVNRAAQYGVTDPYGRGRATTFIDANNDQWPDLFVGNDKPRPDGRPTPNRLFINVNGTSFVEAKVGLTREIGARCAQAVDYNFDGWEDLLVCGNGKLWLFRNQNGKFVDVTSAVGIAGAWLDAELVDLDNDGFRDLAQVSKKKFQVKLWDPLLDMFGGASYQNESFVNALAIASGDINGDGKRDVYVLQTGLKNDKMLRNEGGGNDFAPVEIPQAASGNGQAVERIDYNGDGRSDFVVLNGKHQTPGPVQLITFS
jgi:VCBS repeat protein